MSRMRRDMVLHHRRNTRGSTKPTLLRHAEVSVPFRTPNSELAERMVLSALFKDYELVCGHLDRIGLTRGDLYFDHHQRVCRAMKEVENPPEVADVFERMRNTREDVLIWGGWRTLAIWLAEVYELDPTGCSVEYNASIVKRLSVRRRIIHRATELIRDAYKTSMSPEEYESRLVKLQGL